MLHYIVSNREKSQKYWASLSVDNGDLENASAFVVIGGDGFMLNTIRDYGSYQKPFFGINKGTVGFLMNAPRPNDACDVDFEKRVQNANACLLTPLHFKATNIHDEIFEGFALNEVAINRQISSAISVTMTVDDQKHITCRGDGVILSTPAGSAAYNSSAGGPIIPIGSNVLALTPICSYAPMGWRGALLSDTSHVQFDINEPAYRPATLHYDGVNIPDIKTVTIKSHNDMVYNLLFDTHHNLESRIMDQQFR